MQKSIVVGGFNKEQREKNLEKLKIKYAKKGYKFLSFKENGALKSIAIFEVDENILKKEKAKSLYIVAGIFILLSVYLFVKASV
ncbi:hypothetical protein [Poseidonibacter antarcticus]|uniref:hypothetical protein n=1 Tax=Poseidonibacter antarcticus TaxID=2478538 RepID=UPI000EF45A00|nr:hypothetical protein [Poseidonibacter antarcticus]